MTVQKKKKTETLITSCSQEWDHHSTIVIPNNRDVTNINTEKNRSTESVVHTPSASRTPAKTLEAFFSSFPFR